MSMAARRRQAEDDTGEMTWGTRFERPSKGRGMRQQITVAPDEMVLTLSRSEAHALIDCLRARLVSGFDPAAAALLQRIMTR